MEITLYQNLAITLIDLGKVSPYVLTKQAIVTESKVLCGQMPFNLPYRQTSPNKFFSCQTIRTISMT
jgi:hypothetical protein